MLSIIYKGIAIPIFWELLDKQSLFRLGLDFFQEKFRMVLLFSECDCFDWLIAFLMIDTNTISLISKDN